MASPSSAVTIKLADTLMMLTRVVEEARVRAAVKRVHMARLKRRLRPKKEARMANSTKRLVGERERREEMACAQVVVRDVVVLVGTEVSNVCGQKCR